ncbi:MAG: hypothetical protein GY930_15425 [bacterium]|nr:hypothetical protein [bacterium]
MLAPALHLDSPHSPETARLEFLSTSYPQRVARLERQLQTLADKLGEPLED